MELTPGALREVTFRGRLGGYNVDDVDEFVEKVAVGVGELLDQLRLVSERSAAAERRAKELAASEEAMRRTLVHAQKLADAVLAEAREEASRLRTEAHEQVTAVRARAKEGAARTDAELAAARAEIDRLRAEVEAERAAARADADVARGEALAEAERLRAQAEDEKVAALAEVAALKASASEALQADVRAELDRLEGVRRTLQLEAAALVGWLEQRKAAATGLLGSAIEALEQGSWGGPPAVTVLEATPRGLDGGAGPQGAGSSAAGVWSAGATRPDPSSAVAASPDLSSPDLTSPDLSGPDLSSPDLSSPDLSGVDTPGSLPRGAGGPAPTWGAPAGAHTHVAARRTDRDDRPTEVFPSLDLAPPAAYAAGLPGPRDEGDVADDAYVELSDDEFLAELQKAGRVEGGEAADDR